MLSEAALEWTDEKHDDGSPVKGRVWLSSHVDCSIPLSVLEQCVCVAVDAPKVSSTHPVLSSFLSVLCRAGRAEQYGALTAVVYSW